jgi:hypothetical protein
MLGVEEYKNEAQRCQGGWPAHPPQGGKYDSVPTLYCNQA